jgi:hypothetical protein
LRHGLAEPGRLSVKDDAPVLVSAHKLVRVVRRAIARDDDLKLLARVIERQGVLDLLRDVALFVKGGNDD